MILENNLSIFVQQQVSGFLLHIQAVKPCVSFTTHMLSITLPYFKNRET